MSQKRLLTAPTSKLTKTDLVAILRKPASWADLPASTQQALYALLPPLALEAGESPPPHTAHPLTTMYKPFVEAELRRWQDDLREGKEGRGWREQAARAGEARRRGEFDAWKEREREGWWGVRTGGVEGGGEKAPGEGEGKENGSGGTE